MIEQSNVIIDVHVHTQDPEVIKEEINGCLYEAGDPNGLYNKLLLLLSNEEYLNKLTIGAKKTDISNWSLEFMGKKINDLYNTFL